MVEIVERGVVPEDTQLLRGKLDALVHAIHPEFRILPIGQGFDWPGILAATSSPEHEVEQFYLVVFRSQLLAEADPKIVAAHDAAAHQEALASPSLLHYFAGDRDDEGRALSWCLWRDRESAWLASKGCAHQQAARRALTFYGSGGYTLERYDAWYRSSQCLEQRVLLVERK